MNRESAVQYFYQAHRRQLVSLLQPDEEATPDEWGL